MVGDLFPALGGSDGVSVHGSSQVETVFTMVWGGEAAQGNRGRARSSDAWVAADPSDGDVYVAYVHRDASQRGQIYVARSTDEGVSWSARRVTDGLYHSAYPTLAVNSEGVVGLLYIDFDDSGRWTVFRHRFAYTSDDGVSWQSQTIQAMKPKAFVPAHDSFLWGDYEGLTSLGRTFYGVFTGLSIGRVNDQLDPIFFEVTP